MLCGLITTDISTKLISLVQISNKTHSKTSYLNKNIKIRLAGTIYFYIFVKISSIHVAYFDSRLPVVPHIFHRHECAQHNQI